MTPASAPAGDADDLLVGHDEIRRYTGRLREIAGSDWMALESFEAPVPGRDAIDIPVPRREGIRMRTVYDERYLRDPAGLQIIRARVAAGEEARVRPRIDHRMRLADSAAGLVIMAPSWTGFALLIRSAPVLTVLRRQFERNWAEAAPFEALTPVPAATASHPGPPGT